MVWKPDVTVAAVVERDGRFLFVEERASGRVVINQPAGHLENGETLSRRGKPRDARGNGLDVRARQRSSAFTYGGRARGAHIPAHRLQPAVEAHDPATPARSRHPGAHAGWTAISLLGVQTRLRSPLVLRCVDDYLAGTRYPLHCCPTCSRTVTAESIAAGG